MATPPALRTTEDWQINDFDSVLQFNNRVLWKTPDPSKEKAQYEKYGYSVGTYHETSTEGQSFSFNFTGIRIALYGATGPDYGSFNVNIDGTEGSYSAWAAQRTNSTKLWEASGLQPFAGHTLTVTNGNATFLVDHLQLLTDLAAPGSDSDVTVYEEDSATYTGEWGHNKSPEFSGGGSTFTSENGATATLSFQGSSVAIFGDTNANHGFYTVKLDDQEPITLMSATGCSLPFTVQGQCELTQPNLMALYSYLPEGNHTIVLTSVVGANKTFVDIDRFTVVRPRQYLIPPSSSVSSSGTNNPTTTGNGPTITGNGQLSIRSTPTGTSSGPAPTDAPGAAGHRAFMASGYLLMVLWALLFH